MPMAVLQRCVAGLCLLLPSLLQAEAPVFRSFGAAQGLPSERVYALAQDPHGCLWVGTADGLARFDGAGFRVFHHDPAMPEGLAGNVIQALHVDAAGTVWVGAEGGGVVAVDADEERLQRLRSNDADDAGRDVWSITTTAADALWFGGFGYGLVRVDPRSGELRQWRAGEAVGPLSDHILSLHADGQGGLWVGSYGGLEHFDGERFTPVDQATGLPRAVVLKVLGGGDGLRVATAKGAFRREGERFVPLPGGEGRPALSLLEDADGVLWLGRDRGLQRVGADGSLHDAFPASARAARHVVLDLLRDSEDGLWIASDGGGLHTLPARWRRFRSWQGGGLALATETPAAVAFDAQGRLWSAGSDGHLERIDAEGEVSRIAEATAAWPDRVASALWFTADSAWVGLRRGFVRIRLADGAQTIWRPDGSDDAPAVGIIDLAAVAADGQQWLSVHGGGIERRDGEGRLLRRYTTEHGLAALDTEQLRLIDGQPWVAGAGGVLRFDPAAERFVALAGLAEDRVFGFDRDAEGLLWIATRAGLRALREQAGVWREVRRLDSPSGLELGGLQRDRSGALWATSARGLWRIDLSRGGARRYGVRDGLPGQEFAARPPQLDASGSRLAAVLPTALLQVDTTLFSEPPHPPPLRMEALELRRDGSPLRLRADGPVQLMHDDREITFQARLRSFADPADFRYRMRLAPLDADWVALDGSARRVFPQLPPGSYQMQVAAAGADGEWSETAPLAVVVAPPWWQSPAAMLGQLVLLIALLGLGYRVLRQRAEARARRALRESQRQLALAASEQKSRFLATLAHEIRTPMTGLLGMAELLQRSPLQPMQQDQVAALRSAGEVLLRLVNDALDLARIEAGRLEIRPRPFVLRQLLDDCLALARPLAEAKRLELNRLFDPALPAVVQGDPERLQQVLLNLLGNAIKFPAVGGVGLRVEPLADGRIALDVLDSGPGMDATEQARLLQRFEQGEGEDTARRHGGAGLGLAISTELVRLMGGELRLDSTPGEGTTVHVLLPLPAVQQAAAAPTPEAAPAGLSVLLVEDDPAAASALTAMLEHLDCRVAVAAHALAALSLLGEAAPQIAFVDLDLPGLDGLQLLPLLRQTRPGLALAVLTARAEADTEARARAAGATVFLRKPTTLALLQQALRELAGSHAG
jgi:signal transduction histidine kinase